MSYTVKIARQMVKEAKKLKESFDRQSTMDWSLEKCLESVCDMHKVQDFVRTEAKKQLEA